MGWFGWTFTTVILVVLAGSLLFFSNLFHLDLTAFFDRDQQKTVAKEEKDKTDNNKEAKAKETVDKVEEVQDTVGQSHKEIGKFVSDMHDFYNETTGYGAINSLDWDEQTKQAEKVSVGIDEEITSVKSDVLRTDLEHIKQTADTVLSKKTTDSVRNLHRLFHDLDIALNDYNGYDKIWGVTETLKAVHN
ncbi:hypothetical protein KK120_11485 [Virgibacillus dakarensis]|nr:hypothetical protein [Virgibacillus dakarensis]